MIDKSRAWDYAVKRGWMTNGKIMEASEAAQTGPPTLTDVRRNLISLAADADNRHQTARAHSLRLAINLIDDAREAT